MKYLRELVKKIPKEHYELIQKDTFSNTEKLLLNYYRQETKDLEDDELAIQYNIKTSTLKKTQSKLLNQLIVLLSSHDILDQTKYLSSVNCHRILLHIAKKEISKLKKENNFEQLAKIYLDVPYRLLSSVISDYNIKDLKKFKLDYKILKPEKSFESVKLEILVYILEFMQFRKISPVQEKMFQEQCLSIDTLGEPELEFWKNKLIGEYYQFTDEKKYFEIIRANLDLVNNNVFTFNEKLIINTKLQYCFYLINSNQFQETYNFYHKLIKEYPNKMDYGKGLRYVDLISQVCIVLGKYDEAKKWILSAYPIEDEEPGKFAEMYFGNTTILAMLDILENNYDKAFKKIAVAKIGLKKQYFIYLDALLRLVEQAYYLKTKDYDFADTLYLKNLKFYKYHDVSGLEIMGQVNYYGEHRF